MKNYIKDKLQTKLKELNLMCLQRSDKLLYDETVLTGIVLYACWALSSGHSGYYELVFRYDDDNCLDYIDNIKFIQPAFLMTYQAIGKQMIYLDLADLRDHKLVEVLELKCHTLTN